MKARVRGIAPVILLKGSEVVIEHMKAIKVDWIRQPSADWLGQLGRKKRR